MKASISKEGDKDGHSQLTATVLEPGPDGSLQDSKFPLLLEGCLKQCVTSPPGLPHAHTATMANV